MSKYKWFTKDNIYWFKWEPIKWRVLNAEADGLYVMSEYILDSQEFDITGKSANWEKASLRIWLNQQFYENVFTANEKNKINLTTHQNKGNTSDGTVDYGEVTDNIWLLSWYEMKSKNYGFSSSKYSYDLNRQSKGTEYAKCQGLMVSTDSDYFGKSPYRLITKTNQFSGTYYVSSNGSILGDSELRGSYYGVRPVLKLNLDAEISNPDPIVEDGISFYDTEIYGNTDESKGALFILDSNHLEISDITFQSSDTNVVDIETISIGEGQYITQGNEQIATIYLNCKKEGTATITASAPDGSTAILNVTVESKPAVQKSIAVLTTEKSLSVKTGDKMWLAFGLMDDTTQTLDGQWKKMAITNSDSTVLSLSDYSETDYGYSLELTGLIQGASHLTITDTETGANTIITVSVYDQYVKSYSYAIDNAPTLYPQNKYEQHIATNIYDLNGLYVNNYSCKTTSSGYDISFDVYNSRYYSGAVDIYDASGTLINYEEIEKFSDISNLWDTGEQTYYLISDKITKNIFTYQQASFSKCTHIKFSVSNGGYFTISNNIAESPSVALLNSLEILFDTTCDFFDLAISGSEKATAFDGFKSSIKEQALIEIREGRMEIALNTLKKETKDIMKKLIKTDFKNRISMSNEVYSDMSTLSESILSSYSINWKHFFKSATGVGESYFTKFAGPAGVALKGCFAITKGSNKLLRATQMSASCDNTYATFYSNKNDCNINQHGVVVNTQGNVDAEAVLQVFKVSNDDTIVSAIDSSFDKYELYNISFVKNDQLVQPSGKVTVRIPIPQGMKGNTCKVYRKENNNEWTILDAHIEGNYLVFETDHFSLYTVVGDSESISITSLPTTLEYFNGQSLDTTGIILCINGEEITDGFVCNPTVISGYGTQTITVMYGDLATEFNVTVKMPLLGDVDGDDNISIVDGTFIQRHIASITIPFVLDEAIADTDEDGIVSIMDATYIQRWLANLKANDNIGSPIP